MFLLSTITAYSAYCTNWFILSNQLLGPIVEIFLSPEILTGLFSLAGALIGGLITYATTRLDRRWERAVKEISRLCDEVAAYHQLEKLYKAELASAENKGRSEKTVMEEMRARVAQSGEYVRPSMTTLAAQKVRRDWA